MRPAHTVFAIGGGTRPGAGQFCLLTAVAIMSSVQLGILSGADQTTPEAPPQPANHVLTILDGTQARVRLAQTLNTRLVRSGDSFSAVLDETVTLRDSIVLPKVRLSWAVSSNRSAPARFADEPASISPCFPSASTERTIGFRVRRIAKSVGRIKSGIWLWWPEELAPAWRRAVWLEAWEAR